VNAKMKLLDKLSLLVLFIMSRSWLSITSNNPVGVDAWDYMSWVNQSVTSKQLHHAPLHVPGFYALLSCISAYTGFDPLYLYTTIFPILGAVVLWFAMRLVLAHQESGLLISCFFGFFVIRTSLIIPEWLGLMLLPFALYSFRQYDTSDSHFTQIVTLLLFCSFSTTIIFAHHLSGGIILLFSLSIAVVKRKRVLYITNIYLLSLSFIVWNLADAFPIKLLGIAFNNSFYFAFLLLFPLLFHRKLSLNTTHLLIVVLLFMFAIAYSTGLTIQSIIYWSPVVVFLPLTSRGIKSISHRKYNDNVQIIWSGSLILLIIFLALVPVIRPLIARILVFELQSLIPLMALGLTSFIEESSQQDWRKKASMFFIIGLLTLTFFHSYPNSDAWFRTEFRYYDEEVEIAAFVGKWFPKNTFLDTDNRFGVMFKAITGLDSTYGEYNQSWMANQLAGNYQIGTYVHNASFLLTSVTIKVGFMTGKFIHGKGGGASKVSVAFDRELLRLLSSKYSRPVAVGHGFFWVSDNFTS
jgi:hypothetical protein